VLPEVDPRRRLDPVDPLAEVDLVEVRLEDLVLVVLVLDLRGDADLQQLALDGALGGGRRSGKTFRATCMVMVLAPWLRPPGIRLRAVVPRKRRQSTPWCE
jgi:hypothetical protein